ncbi:ANTAR domain-containing response regulator [Imhoffiella purpurea]|uniref:Two component, sigma54 specific, transcriptional regulator, Fis family n=1 Tax=Imhoffiella purpurea TaxID=1249627 RepID=W9W2A9_9GAMM|nr:response regulator [Imhoffiella purpurea]EXJ16715.1 two component, sigma54 specific, transcriptional regulator, Fis family [Imhoffiella purpurea]
MYTSTLLVVDDDEVVLATFGKGLRDAGFLVELASSGSEALMKARSDPPDLAILDLRMPGLSGVDTADLMREMGVPVVFLSAYDDRESVEQAVSRGALGYLVKPIDAVRAIPGIRTALERAREIRDLLEQKERLAHAVDTGSLVNVAIGILMERHHIGRNEAFETMRERSRNERRKVREVAVDVLNAWQLINDLRPSAPGGSEESPLPSRGRQGKKEAGRSG